MYHWIDFGIKYGRRGARASPFECKQSAVETPAAHLLHDLNAVFRITP
jgi:hypothetical protein